MNDDLEYRIPSTPPPRSAEAVVVGAGLSGLSCALLLERQGVDVHLVEASDDVGGRVRTDLVDGFRLDRGFQVLLTSYEEVRRQVDLPRLSLQSFDPGSVVWTGRGLERLSDPFRNPTGALTSLRARVGSLSDKLKVAKLRREVVSSRPDMSFSGPDRTTLAELQRLGFSAGFIDGFFRPFLGGVFLERDLETSSRLFRYYFRCFSTGDATVPARGMQRLPELLASPLEDRITLSTPATAVSNTGVTLKGGAEISAKFVVVAVDGRAASDLLPGTTERSFKPAITSYFATEQLPTPGPRLILDGEGTGPANHVAVISEVAPEYAPAGAHLVSVSGVDANALDEEAFRHGLRSQLTRWFGPSVSSWRHLRTYRIPRALPVHEPGSLAGRSGAGLRPDGVFVAGDQVEFGAIQGALLSGRKAAEAVLDRR